ncbi:regulator of volume decrease after cellular swelling domain-containing protein [Trichoderma novae-zelandiae]
MLPTTIRSPPAEADYTPLAEYQSQTPESFTDGKPVLHYHLTGAKATIPRSQCGSLAIFPQDSPAAPNASNEDGAAEELVEQTVDVFATSENFVIFSTQAEAGVSIPYPTISIHALQTVDGQQAVWMQLDLADGGSDDSDFQTVELTIIPSQNPSSSEAGSAKQLYEAMANCSDLHPDPEDDDDDENEYDRIVFEGNAGHEAVEGFTGVLRGVTDGGLPPPMPGSGGWITADNVHEYFDADGNWIGGEQGEEEAEPEELGAGAGRTRPRDELEKGEDVNGHVSAEDPESKRPRVDSTGDDA